MSESTLSLTFNQVASWVGRLLNFGETIGSFTATQASEVTDVIARGYRSFLYPPPLKDEEAGHTWSFLRPNTTLTTSEPYSTGTVTIVLGVVTLASGTWPSWAASGELLIAGVGYTVNTRDSGAQITLDDLTVAASAGTVYQIVQTIYTAPDDFAGIDGGMSYAPNTSGACGIQEVDESEIRHLRSFSDWSSDKPVKVAMRPVNTTATAGQRWEFVLWPPPDNDYILSYRYIAQPNVPTTTQYFLGGMAHAETILASCLHVAQQYLKNEDGVKRAMGDFMDRLSASVALDRAMTTPDHMPYNSDSSDRTTVYSLRPSRPMYNGVVTV